MKKIVWFNLIVFTFLCFLSKVNAEVFQCEYSFKEDGPTYIFEFDTENNTGKIINETQDTQNLTMYMYYNYNYNFYEDEIKTYEINTCPVLFIANEQEYSCLNRVNNYDINSGFYTSYCSLEKYVNNYHVYSDSFLREEGGHSCVVDRGDVCLKEFFEGIFTSSMTTTKYYTGILTDSDINKDKTMKSICPIYDLMENKIRDAYKSFSSCSNSSCTNYINIANKNIDKIKGFCKNFLSYRDIIIKNESDNIIQDECIKACLNFNKTLSEIKEDNGITNSTPASCGLSGRLIIWISNIVRWGKYLAPVVVIVLGILDFIKAIASGKDDEMKKAQGRFIKRLISAALIFIVPFIIEFVLNKMGFNANGCGIIDL